MNFALQVDIDEWDGCGCDCRLSKMEISGFAVPNHRQKL
jgi:hypothetical protein